MKIHLSQNVLFNEIGNEYVLLHLDSGEYFGLNEVGVSFWQGAETHDNLDDIIDHLLSIYDIDEPILRADVDELITQLVDAKLIRVD